MRDGLQLHQQQSLEPDGRRFGTPFPRRGGTSEDVQNVRQIGALPGAPQKVRVRCCVRQCRPRHCQRVNLVVDELGEVILVGDGAVQARHRRGTVLHDMTVDRLCPACAGHEARDAGSHMLTGHRKAGRVERRDRARQTTHPGAKHHHAGKQHRPAGRGWQVGIEDLQGLVRQHIARPGRGSVCAALQPQQPKPCLAQRRDRRPLGGRRMGAVAREAVERGGATRGGIRQQQVRCEERRVGRPGRQPLLRHRAHVHAAKPFVDHRLATIARHEAHRRDHQRSDLL